MEPIRAVGLTTGQTSVPSLPTAPRWYARAACAGADLDVFFADSGDDKAELTEYAARRYCNRCPVRADCLAYAVEERVAGIWAGTSEQERRTLRREANAA